MQEGKTKKIMNDNKKEDDNDAKTNKVSKGRTIMGYVFWGVIFFIIIVIYNKLGCGGGSGAHIYDPIRN
jgi:hypothetical protein